MANKIISTLIVMVFGLFLVIFGSGLETGSLRRMGPGFFPISIGYILIFFSIVIGISEARNSNTVKIALRPLLSVLSSILVFMGLIDLFGMAISIIVSVLVSSFGDDRFKLVPALAVGVAVTIFSYYVFIIGLGIRIPLFTFPGL